jgi:DNA polymerase epsilon subunit 1
MPNKHHEKTGRFYDGHLLNSETYVGGHVEALEAGVFRSDLPVKFKLVANEFQQLIDEIDHALEFSITTEGNLAVADVENYQEIRDAIVSALEGLRDTPNRSENPLIYHLDVGAMYT